MRMLSRSGDYRRAFCWIAAFIAIAAAGLFVAYRSSGEGEHPIVPSPVILGEPLLTPRPPDPAPSASRPPRRRARATVAVPSAAPSTDERIEIRLPPITFSATSATPLLPRRENVFDSHTLSSISSVPSQNVWDTPRPRPSVLVPMYVSYGMLHALDVHSTLRGIHSGAREANPLLRSVTGRGPLFISVKAVSFAGTIYLVERLRKRNPAAAVIVMVTLNTAYSFLVAHNYRVAGAMRTDPPSR